MSGRQPIDRANLSWSKSRYSSGEGGACVEFATVDQTVLVRDSKDTALSPITLTPAAWTHFVRYAAQ
ncbi:DUF397 domain-containing protein [Streptomyces sp. NPDC047985]|uniref:DUF397 domain-containing protein n=1 Tax=unclassified Streptomyces TaxID=2593676 RepID=UPI00344886F5